jgi:Cd2+/Zn2+-exporting ATPase
MSATAFPISKHGHHHSAHDHEHSAHCGCGHDHSEFGLKRRLLFVFGGGTCLLLSAIQRWLRPDQLELAVTWGMAGAVLTAVPILLDTLTGLRARNAENSEFYMNQFIMLAVLACFATGQYMTAGIVAIVLLVGHIFEDRSMLGTNEAIQSLLKLSRVGARLLRNGREELVDAEELSTGDIVRVRPGDTVPADGRVLSGFSTMDQASITGESIPVEVERGTSVFAGASNLTGLIEIEVTRTGVQTVLGRVTRIIEEAQHTRAPIIRLTEEYARYYMPLILLIAGFVLFFTRDIQRAISVIVVSIPCAFVLAGPAAMVAALAAASRMGILVKSVRFFEAANDIDTVVFDKTGTLTSAELKVSVIEPCDGIKEDDLLLFAAAIEQHSTHPIAHAVVSAAKERGLSLIDSTDLREQHGQGLTGCVNGSKMVIGRASWLRAQRIELPQNDDDVSTGLSALHIAIGGNFAGVIYLSDTIRAEATRSTSLLRAEGIRHFMILTGDRHNVAKSIASNVGIADFRADCLPEQKLEAIRSLQAEGRKVLVVGDGVNDAPALAAGDLSMAMGVLGSDVAIQTADVALMASDLKRIPHFLELSDKTLRIINQNMLCGFVFVGAAIVLSGVGLVPPIAAVFIHEFGAFFVIFNSARLLRFEGKEVEPLK